MKTTSTAAGLALTLLTAAAHADATFTFAGPHTLTGNATGFTLTTPALSGTLTGIRVTFTYAPASNNSWASDMAFTVNQHQWGGYLPFINGAHHAQTPTYAPDDAVPVTFTSSELGMDYGVPFLNQSALVGFGNGRLDSSAVVSGVSITLLGLDVVGQPVPTPGAAALLGLGAMRLSRRRR